MIGAKMLSAAALRLRPAVPCIGLALLTGCGGGMGAGSAGAGGTTSMPAACTASDCAPALVTMTDARGDFLSYIVNLTSLRLQTAAGASVETVPAASKVDFAQLVDLTEVISAGQIPAAEYVSATLTLDYTGANITADDGTGTAVPLSPVDVNGAALAGPVTVSIKLDNRHHLVITPGRSGRLAFDFNLAASNTVDLTAAKVTVAPTLVASVVPADHKQVRVRGQIASASGSEFVLKVQPFFDKSLSGGQVTVAVIPTTMYQINGTAYAGAAGITALAGLPADTLVAAFGALQASNQTLTATYVLAGTSLQSPSHDQISGTVIARNGNSLTVRGAHSWMHGGGFEFEHHDVTVNIGTNTGVTEEGMVGQFTMADISVGQHIDAFGTLSDPDHAGDQESGNDSGNGGSDDNHPQDDGKVLDATAGQVRLQLTPAWGSVVSLAAGSATLNLAALDTLPLTAFNFAGTGAGGDANAAAYVVNTGTLSQEGVTVGAPARVFGFVTPFGTSPPDFNARTLVNYSGVAETLVIDWAQRGTTTAFTGLMATSTSLQLDLTGMDKRHFVQLGPEQLDLASLPAAPTIAPDGAAGDVFTIGHRGQLQTENFNTFAGFVTALATELDGTSTVVDLVASGTYDSTTNIFTASRIALLIND